MIQYEAWIELGARNYGEGKVRIEIEEYRVLFDAMVDAVNDTYEKWKRGEIR